MYADSEVIGHRSERDHMALRPLPKTPYVVAQRHLRHVGKDCLVAFDANLYSVPVRKVRPRGWSRAGRRSPRSRCTPPSPMPAVRPCSLSIQGGGRGARIVDESHWDGLPTGTGRRTTTGDGPPTARRDQPLGPETGLLQALLNRAAAPTSKSAAVRCRSMTS